MSGKAYIRHILSLYSAYIGTRWKAGGREDALPFYMPISNRRNRHSKRSWRSLKGT